MHTPGLRLLAAMAVFAATVGAQPRRITGPIENARRVALAGRVHRQATPQNDQGRVDNAFEVADMRLYLRPSGEAALGRLLQDQQDPSSPNYHQWLTPEQYGDRFGASEADVKQIVAWLEAQGFTDVQAARSRTWIRFSGTAAQVRGAFQTEIHRYQVRGEAHFANATDPTVPAAIAGVVTSLSGLHDFRMQPRLRRVGSRMNVGGGDHALAPDDVATIYNIAPLYRDGVDGAGQRIAVVGQSAIRETDIANFRSRFGLPSIKLELNRPLRGAPGIRDGDVDEAHLDIQWTGAVARNATIVYVYRNNVWDAALDAVDANLAPVISMSYGLCEAADLINLPTYRQTAQQANAQGITWFAAAGDNGAADCEDRSVTVAQNGFAVDSPASIPEITAMGGTQFDDDGPGYWAATNGPTGASALGYIPERVWNDNGAFGIGGGGGGTSLVFPRPSWQTGPGVPAGGRRLVPDISLSSSALHVGYFVYSDGPAYFGGTSVAAPVMAGVASLLNQYLVQTGAAPRAGLGNINPNLYRMAATPLGAEAFHDILNGDNGVACAAGTPDCVNGYLGHFAAPGYDLATGLGSIDADKLVRRWTNHPAISSAVVPAISDNPVFQSAGAWTFTLSLQEQAGIGTRLTGFTIDGVSRPVELALFSSTTIAPRGTISAKLTLTGIAAPKDVVFGFTGVDASGATWSTTFFVPFRGAFTTLRIAGVSNAASGAQVFAPGMIMSVYGEGMSERAQAAAAVPLTEYLAGFMAWINGVPAPLYYVSPNQVNIQIPYETQAGSATLEITNPWEFSDPYRFTVSSAAPGIFTLADGRVNPSHTGARGQVVTLFITGEGQVTPTLRTGSTPSSRTAIANLPRPRLDVAVTVGGAPATVEFAGIPSGLVGVTQINFRIPAGVAPGEQAVVVTIGGAASNTARILVQ